VTDNVWQVLSVAGVEAGTGVGDAVTTVDAVAPAEFAASEEHPAAPTAAAASRQVTITGITGIRCLMSPG
jgi:hypothetical protein